MKPLLLLVVCALAAVPLAYAAQTPLDGSVTDAARRTLLPAHALLCGAPTLDVTDYDLVGMEATGTRHPDLPPEMKVLTFTEEQWRCIFPSEDVQDVDGPVRVHPGQAVEVHARDARHDHPVPLHSNNPRTGGHGGYLKVVTVAPYLYDPLYPAEGCNNSDFQNALNALLATVGGIASWQKWCYYTSGSNVWNTYDDHSAVNQWDYLHGYIDVYQSHWVDEANEIVVGMVAQLDHNGLTYDDERIHIFAEDVDCCAVDLYDDAIILHEIAHGFMGQHHPSESLKWYCSYENSNMNYCDMGWSHAMAFDSWNDNVITSNYHAS